MSGLQDILRGYGSTAENIATTLLSSTISQSIPAIVSQLAAALDPYVRDTKEKNAVMQMVNTSASKIPFVRNTLPEKVNVAGRSVRTKEGIRNFIDPFSTTDAINDPALNERMRLSDALGSSEFLPSDALSGTRTALTGVQTPVEGKQGDLPEALRRAVAVGRRYLRQEREVGNGDRRDRSAEHGRYQRLSDEEKAEVIKEMVDRAKAGAAYETGEKLGHARKENFDALPVQFCEDA